MKVTFLVLLFISLVFSDHLKCDVGVVDYYRYSSTLSQDGQPSMKLDGLLGVSCTGVTVVEGIRGDVLAMVIEVADMKIEQLNKGKDPEQKNHDEVEEYKKSFQKPLSFLQKRNGEIPQILYLPGEKPSILSLKKSIVTSFQVKLAGESNVEKTQAGEVQYYYEKSEPENGKEVIRKYSTEVLKQADPTMKRKDNKYKLESFIQINPEDKKIHRIATTEGSAVGKPSARRHKEFEKERTKVKNEERPDDFKESGAGQAFDFGSETVIQLVQTGEIKNGEVKLNKFKLPEKQGEDPQEAATLSFHDILGGEFTTSTLEIDPALIAEHKELARQKYIAETDFPQLLSKIKDDTKDHNLLAKAHMYVNHYGENIVPHIATEYNKLDLKNKDHLDYGVSLLSMFAASQTVQGQKELLKTMDSPHVVQQAVINTMSIDKPIDEIVDKLRTLSMNDKFEGLHEHEAMDVKTNAYLAYAHTASKIHHEKAIKILDEISDNIKKASTVNEFEREIHALGNTGEVAPLHSLAVIATNEYLPLDLRLAAVNGLSNRVAEHSHPEVTRLLHHLMGRQYHESVRVAAVKAQTKRESEIQDGVSVLHVKQYLEDTRTPSTLVQAIKDYYHEEGSDEAHRILDATKLGINGHIGERKEAVKVMALEGYFDHISPDSSLDNLDEAMVFDVKPLFFRRVGRFFRRAVSSVRNAVSRVADRARNAFRAAGRWIGDKAKQVGRAIVNVAKEVYNKTVGAVVEKVKAFVKKLQQSFSKAQFKGEKVCNQVNSAGSSICMYDPDMVAFIRKQGDLTHMKWTKQFSFETLIGVEVLHAYVGAVGYAGTRIDCATNSFDIVVFGRGEAKARLFSRRVPILNVEVELQKRTGEELVDRAYLAVFKGVIYNSGFVPEKIRAIINMCEKTSRPLIKPVRKTLVNFSFSIVVVVVPLTFNFQVSGEMGVDLVTIICPGRLTLTVSVQPYVGIGVAATAGIGFAAISGGVKVDFEANYRLKPSFGTSNCNLCAVLAHEVRPITITISLAAKAFVFKVEKELYKYQGPVINQELFRLCLFKNKPYDPESVVNQGPPPEGEAPAGEQAGGEQPPAEGEQPAEQ